MEIVRIKTGDNFVKVNIDGDTYVVSADAFNAWGGQEEFMNKSNSGNLSEEDNLMLIDFKKMYSGYILNDLAEDLIKSMNLKFEIKQLITNE